MKVNTERLTAKQVKMITEETRRQIAENLAVLSKEIEATIYTPCVNIADGGRKSCLNFTMQ